MLAAAMNRNSVFRPGVLLAAVLLLVALSSARNAVWNTSLTLWGDAVAKSPDKVRPHYYLGEAYHGRKQYAEALALYQRAITLDPTESLNAYGNIGNLYLDNGDFERAAQLFTRLLAIDASDFQSYVGRGKASYARGRYAESLADFSRAVALAPAVSRYYLYRAEAYLKLEEPGRAREDLVRSCEMRWEESCRRLKEIGAK